MQQFSKIYLEITNRCNLRCAFCPGTARPGRAMTEAEFSDLLPKLRPHTENLYFHLMGEPLCHPLLPRFLALAGEAGFRVSLTTNGTLLPARQAALLAAPALRRVNVSLHAFEANDLPASFADYLAGCCAFGQAADGVHVAYRLWNGGGANRKNEEILAALRAAFPEPWEESHFGLRLRRGVTLHHAEQFAWPSLSAPDYGPRVSCRGLRTHLGVLCDGTVVPCCLDGDGVAALGNLHERPLEQILNSPRALALAEGFRRRNAPEPLCRRCGYANRFR